ncbi:MAG: heparan-alpha-glucosaminide N-acetyltransferase domain-containing protein [bacterium]
MTDSQLGRRASPHIGARDRIESVDVVRGIIMIIMALDHTRDFFGNAAVSPTNLAQASVALFFTRWVTNICAPVFFLLTGAGSYLSLRRRTRPELSRFLVTRGLWLILIELTLMRFLLQFNVDYRVTLLTVLWALGWSMTALGGLVLLPTWIGTAFGLLLILTHNVLDAPHDQWLGALAPVWRILHSPSVLNANPDHFLFQGYPVIPWIGVTAVGFALGKLFDWPAAQRRSVLLKGGIAITVGFVALRALNIYGDPVPWSTQRTATYTALSFLNVNKYPPSLLFLMMTLGPALLLLGALNDRTPRLLRPVLTIGKVPMFYFLLHFGLIHLVAVIVCLVRYGTVHWMFESPSLDKYPITQPPGWPLTLPLVYVVWIGVVISVYPACRWYASLRKRRTDWWLSYF